MFPSPRRSILAALALLALVAGSGLLCLQAKRAFDVTVLADAPGGGFEVRVEPHGVAACLSHAFAAAVR
jgi:hypothetical protein